MNILDKLKEINEIEISEEENRLNLIREKCLNLKSPTLFSEKIGTINDLTNVIELIKQNIVGCDMINKIKKNLIDVPAEKSSSTNFI